MDDLAAGQAATDHYQLGPATVAQLRRVAVAADRGRAAVPILTGVLLDGHQVAATDDRRLAMATIAEDLPRLVLPARPLTRAARGGADGLTLDVGGQTVRLRANRGSRSWALPCLPAVGYPDLAPHLDRLHPDELVEVEVAALRDVVAPWAGRTPSLLLCPDDGQLRVVADTTPLATFAATSTASGPLAVAPGLLLDLLATAAGETVRLQISRRPPPGVLLLREGGFAHALLCCRQPGAEAAA